MHDSSFEKMSAFVREYLTSKRDVPLRVLDFGSQTVDEQGLSYRGLFDAASWSYEGLDIAPGANVDVVVANPFEWTEVATDSVDLVVSGQAMEHVDYFWVAGFEIGRVLRPGGIAVLIAPSSGPEHRYPLDCWRYYPDGFVALAAYLGFEVLDVYTDWGREPWADTIVVMRKPVWDESGRAAFLMRAAHQRAVLDPASYNDEVPTLASVEPSPLADLTGQRLTPVLDRLSAESVTTAPLGARLRQAARVALGRS